MKAKMKNLRDAKEVWDRHSAQMKIKKINGFQKPLIFLIFIGT